VAAAEIRTHGPDQVAGHFPRWEEFTRQSGRNALSWHPAWLNVLARGLAHVPYCVEAVRDGRTCGLLPLAYVRSWLFGRFLVGLPYLNSGGVVADDATTAAQLIDAGVRLADKLDARHLELRHEQGVEHASLSQKLTTKVHMRLALPETTGQLWDQLSAKVRNQVRKGQKGDFTVVWGGADLLDDFYAVFSENMRDLGTPVYGRGLFRAILEQFPGDAELCVVRAGAHPAAGALLLHGRGVTEVPSASALRQYNSANVNMLMYWHLLERAGLRGQRTFDFGRSTRDGNTFRFKKQWGALPEPAEWQYYVRRGAAGDMRPDNPRYQRFIRIWQRLPLGVTRLLGPRIVRGVP
jgi:FemAB-related protein (PEP-CTERM system-associated)